MPEGQDVDDGTPTQRERRADHRRQQAVRDRAASAKRTLRRAAPLLLVAALAVAAVGGMVYLNSAAPGCPDHWHSTFAVYLDGREVQFTHPDFFSPPSGSHDAHMHGNDQVLHYHPQPQRCVPLDEMMGIVGVQPGDGVLVLSPAHGAEAATYEADGNRTLRYFHQPYGEAWREVAWSEMRGRQLGNGDKWLIHYGPDASIAQEQAAVPDLPAEYKPT